MQYGSYTEKFIDRWEKFIVGCDALEESGKWNKDELGEMEAYYENDMISIILRLIVCDDRITVEESDYLNEMFGFKYSPEELRELYEGFTADVGADPDSMLIEGYSLLKSISPELAAYYRELVSFTCGIISESDGAFAHNEFRTANHIIALFESK